MKQKEKRSPGALSFLYAGLVYLFLYLPIFMVVGYSFNTNDNNLVFKGFTLHWYGAMFRDHSLMRSLLLTLELALVSTLISVVLGTLAAIGMHRYDFKLKKTLDNMLYVPIVIPELVIGIASLATFTTLNITLSFWTLVIAHVTFCVPFVIITLRARIAGFDKSIEEAAMDLGANQLRTLKRVTIPMLLPGIVSGALLSITLSLDDVIISYFVTGAGDTTLPIKVYGMARGKISTEVYALFTTMIVITISIYLLAMLMKSIAAKRRK
ncbi:MAG: ABC transporter permease [Lachnospiraceae bacterium]|nr:ABC transporter permease [Lachnospiraceae bacterium]